MISALLLAAMSLSAPAAALTIIGEVEARYDGSTRAVERRDIVPEGAVVSTRADSRATFRLASGTLLRMGPNTVLTLRRLEHDERIPARRKETVQLKAGRIWASVLSLFGADSKFEVEGKTAVAGVRGTSFFMTSDGDDEKVTLEEGVVAVELEGENIELNQPGQSLDVGTREITQLSSNAIGALQNVTGGGGSQALQQLGAGPSTEQEGPPPTTLVVRQEINGQDEAADSNITLENDPATEVRDIADVTIRLVPED